jgi:hypothetical protein
MPPMVKHPAALFLSFGHVSKEAVVLKFAAELP